jgi:nickel-dependent lactate racemase
VTLSVTRVSLPYGSSSVEVKVPTENLAGILLRRDIPPLKDELSAIRHALRSPIASRPLAGRLKSSDKVAVLATDNTRACPDIRLLPPLLAEIEEVVPRQNITIIVALGLHAPLGAEALLQKLGKPVMDNYRVLNHHPDQTLRLGITARGSPVEIYREVAAADFVVSTGFIEPHFFAGFSGGRKSIMPGVSSAAAISRNHSYQMLGHKNSRAGVLRGNPVHEDLVEQARMAGLDFILNVLLDPQGRIVRVVAGDPFLAHLRGCRLEKKLASATIDRLADITIASNSGAPLDLDLYQACKAMDTAARITRPGGIILVASLCNEGVGPRSFYELQATCPTPDEILNRIKNNEVEGVAWQNQILARVQQAHSVYLFSCLPADVVEAAHIHPVASLEVGIREALHKLGKNARIAVIPDGPRVLASVAAHA